MIPFTLISHSYSMVRGVVTVGILENILLPTSSFCWIEPIINRLKIIVNRYDVALYTYISIVACNNLS